ncbi:hypothetical protein [Comamonas koreensis]|uniref:Uncharacterized protein n=1 Tax=Comamonas koreensis TaxID=160825 RepID=A0AAW4XXZ5_9BURK|nr:hypothetical protein [Comamonas koreensis]MCD2166050.1 hypothetical protein [Comamonas koreensis]
MYKFSNTTYIIGVIFTVLISTILINHSYNDTKLFHQFNSIDKNQCSLDKINSKKNEIAYKYLKSSDIIYSVGIDEKKCLILVRGKAENFQKIKNTLVYDKFDMSNVLIENQNDRLTLF